MTARTVIVPTATVVDGFTSLGAGITPDAVNGNTIADPGPDHLALIVKNGDSAAHTITVRASGNGNDATGAAQSFNPSNVVFEGSTLGDLAITIPAGGMWYEPKLTSSRFKQADGSLSLDWDASTSVLVYAIQLPYPKLGGPTI